MLYQFRTLPQPASASFAATTENHPQAHREARHNRRPRDHAHWSATLLSLVALSWCVPMTAAAATADEPPPRTLPPTETTGPATSPSPSTPRSSPLFPYSAPPSPTPAPTPSTSASPASSTAPAATSPSTPAATNTPAPAPTAPPPAQPIKPANPHPTVWEAALGDFSAARYRDQVEQLFQKFEQDFGHRLVPGEKRKVGLKIYADSGPGLATPLALTQAVIAALETRGYTKQDIFLVGLNEQRLRYTGYLPSLSTGTTVFTGHKVYVLESGRYFDPVWFYDSPLPSRFDPILAQRSVESFNAETSIEEDRKSFLATPLFVDADFWINLPVYTDHPVLGVNGALVNATLWNASNTARFFRSPATAPAAVAEMSAIPELRQTWLFTLASLEQYQFIGGPWFNSLYTVSEPRLWLSTDPVILDALMQEKINSWRARRGFKPLSVDIRTLEFAAILGVGSRQTAGVRLIKVSD